MAGGRRLCAPADTAAGQRQWESAECGGGATRHREQQQRRQLACSAGPNSFSLPVLLPILAFAPRTTNALIHSEREGFLGTPPSPRSGGRTSRLRTPRARAGGRHSTTPPPATASPGANCTPGRAARACKKNHLPSSRQPPLTSLPPAPSQTKTLSTTTQMPATIVFDVQPDAIEMGDESEAEDAEPTRKASPPPR